MKGKNHRELHEQPDELKEALAMKKEDRAAKRNDHSPFGNRSGEWLNYASKEERNEKWRRKQRNKTKTSTKYTTRDNKKETKNT